MLRAQEEIVMFVQEGSMESDQSHPLFVGEFGVVLGSLGVVDLDTLALYHDQASVDALDLGDELLLADGPCLGGGYQTGRIIGGGY